MKDERPDEWRRRKRKSYLRGKEKNVAKAAAEQGSGSHAQDEESDEVYLLLDTASTSTSSVGFGLWRRAHTAEEERAAQHESNARQDAKRKATKDECAGEKRLALHRE